MDPLASEAERQPQRLGGTWQGTGNGFRVQCVDFRKLFRPEGGRQAGSLMGTSRAGEVTATALYWNIPGSGMWRFAMMSRAVWKKLRADPMGTEIQARHPSMGKTPFSVNDIRGNSPCEVPTRSCCRSRRSSDGPNSFNGSGRFRMIPCPSAQGRLYRNGRRRRPFPSGGTMPAVPVSFRSEITPAFLFALNRGSAAETQEEAGAAARAEPGGPPLLFTSEWTWRLTCLCRSQPPLRHKPTRSMLLRKRKGRAVRPALPSRHGFAGVRS